MKISTRDFGEITVKEEDVITFSFPILGFEDDKDYVILLDDEMDGMFSWLQSVNSAETCFVLTDPSIICENYEPNIAKGIKKELGITAENAPVYRVLTVIPEDFSQATVNLKSPIVFCTQTKRAAQIVLDEDYPVRELLLSAQ